MYYFLSFKDSLKLGQTKEAASWRDIKILHYSVSASFLKKRKKKKTKQIYMTFLLFAIVSVFLTVVYKSGKCSGGNLLLTNSDTTFCSAQSLQYDWLFVMCHCKNVQLEKCHSGRVLQVLNVTSCLSIGQSKYSIGCMWLFSSCHVMSCSCHMLVSC